MNVNDFILTLPHIGQHWTNLIKRGDIDYRSLNEIVLKYRPQIVAEIGVGYGYGSIAIMYDNPYVKQWFGYVDGSTVNSGKAKENLIFAAKHCFADMIIDVDTDPYDVGEGRYDMVVFHGHHSKTLDDVINSYWLVAMGGHLILVDNQDYRKDVAQDIMDVFGDESILHQDLTSTT